MSWEEHPDGWRRGAATPDTLVIVLHGYSRSGEIIKNTLGRHLADALPNAAFFAPHGFEEYEGGDYTGRQWFSRLDITPALRLERIERIYPRLSQLFDDELQRVGLPPARLVIAGFSQGAILAQHHALRSPHKHALALAYSGRLATPVQPSAGTPVTIVYGTADQGLDEVDSSVNALRAAGISVELHLLDDVAHVITPEGIRIGIEAIGKV